MIEGPAASAFCSVWHRGLALDQKQPPIRPRDLAEQSRVVRQELLEQVLGVVRRALERREGVVGGQEEGGGHHVNMVPGLACQVNVA